MTKISIRHGLGIGPVRTTDAQADGGHLSRILSAVRDSAGMLDNGDLAMIQSTLERYVGGGTATGTGTSTRDALRMRLAEHAHNKQIADGYRNFWDLKNAEFAAAITR